MSAPVNPANGITRVWHKHIIKAGVDNWFSGPPHVWSNKSIRGDTLGLFYQLVNTSDKEQLQQRRDQYVETYSHWMSAVDQALDLEYMYDRMIAKSDSSTKDVLYSWKRTKEEKRRKMALKEMDRLGPLICLLTKHLNGVIVGDVNHTDPFTCNDPDCPVTHHE